MIWIGVVCEGDRDYDMIKHVAAHFLEEETQWLWLQPNPEFGTQLNGAGWKGVLRWCETHKDDLDLYIRDITPKIDALIIQIDADVARCEEEVYCKRIPCGCTEQGAVDPLNCDLAIKEKCPQTLMPLTLGFLQPSKKQKMIWRRFPLLGRLSRGRRTTMESEFQAERS